MCKTDTFYYRVMKTNMRFPLPIIPKSAELAGPLVELLAGKVTTARDIPQRTQLRRITARSKDQSDQTEVVWSESGAARHVIIWLQYYCCWGGGHHDSYHSALFPKTTITIVQVYKTNHTHTYIGEGIGLLILFVD